VTSFLLAHFITDNDDLVTPVSVAIIFAITPVFAIQGIADYAEPASNACIGLVLLLFTCLMLRTQESPLSWIVNWSALTFGMLLAVVVKRENALLAMWLPAIALVSYLQNKGRPKIAFLSVLVAERSWLNFTVRASARRISTWLVALSMRGVDGGSGVSFWYALSAVNRVLLRWEIVYCDASGVFGTAILNNLSKIPDAATPPSTVATVLTIAAIILIASELCGKSIDRSRSLPCDTLHAH